MERAAPGFRSPPTPYRCASHPEPVAQRVETEAIDRVAWLAKLCVFVWMVVRLVQSVASGRLLEALAALLLVVVAALSARGGRRTRAGAASRTP
jgi:hypothetical protein